MTAPPPLPAGTRFAHYEVREVLGSGGMGTVYLAHDTALDRPVALKVLKPGIAAEPALVERFFREARAAARVSHPNLTHVYFVGTGDGSPFFAMEYCPGSTLEGAVRERGPFALGPGISVLAQAARGLAAAHGGGVIHRDVKPSNLMLLPDGTVKVTDFGLAKSLGGDVAASGGRIMGTPTYMSPEQVRGKPVDARTDVYLLGLTAYWLFTGKPPYESTEVGEMIDAQLHRPLPPVTASRPELPPALDRILARTCAKDPAERPAAMEEVVALLEALRPRPLNPAPILGRAFALVLDLFVLVLLEAAVLGLRAGLSRFAGIDLPGFLEGIAAAALLLLSQAGLERRYGTTVGKVLLHLQVVRDDGTPPGTGALLGRFLLRFPVVLLALVPEGWDAVQMAGLAVQGAAWFLGGLWYFFADGRTLSDVLTRTRVVHRSPGSMSRVP